MGKIKTIDFGCPNCRRIIHFHDDGSLGLNSECAQCNDDIRRQVDEIKASMPLCARCGNKHWVNIDCEVARIYQ